MLSYNKSEIKENLSVENIFELLDEWGGNPEYTSFGIVSSTICHNFPGEGSRKLYYYTNSTLFKCFTECDSSFDIFELVIKVSKIQSNIELKLNEAICWIAYRFGFSPEYSATDSLVLEDWKIFSDYSKIQDIEIKDYNLYNI